MKLYFYGEIIRIKGEKGFSLIGIIVSMIAISIMAAASLPVLKGMIFERRANEVSSLAGILIKAESAYINNNNKFGGINSLQSSGYIADGLGINSAGCIYASIEEQNDTEICLSVNNGIQNGITSEISYSLAIKPSELSEPPNYLDFYNEIRRNIPGSAMINENEIIYISPITGGGAQNAPYSRYIGKSFYITGADCVEYATYYQDAGIYGGTAGSTPLFLYFMVEAVNGNTAILSYANDPSSECDYSSYVKTNINDSYYVSSKVAGAFQNSYLPEVAGWVFYGYDTAPQYENYVPLEPVGYEIEIPANYLPDLISLNQSNTAN